jgi:nucleotidyltransferase/DNA polymerase involved in DNA repair
LANSKVPTGRLRRARRRKKSGRRCPTTRGTGPKRAPTITGPRGASTSGPSAPTEYASPSAPRTRFPSISSHTKPRGTRCERSSKRYGAIARALASRTVTLKVKFANFQIITRSRTGPVPVRTRGELEELGNALREPLFAVARGIRLLGISMSSLSAEEAEQPEFSLPV